MIGTTRSLIVIEMFRMSSDPPREKCMKNSHWSFDWNLKRLSPVGIEWIMKRSSPLLSLQIQQTLPSPEIDIVIPFMIIVTRITSDGSRHWEMRKFDVSSVEEIIGNLILFDIMNSPSQIELHFKADIDAFPLLHWIIVGPRDIGPPGFAVLIHFDNMIAWVELYVHVISPNGWFVRCFFASNRTVVDGMCQG